MGLTSPGPGGVGELGDFVRPDALVLFHLVEDPDVTSGESCGSRRLSKGVERVGSRTGFACF